MSSKPVKWDEFGEVGRIVGLMWESRVLVIVVTSITTLIGIAYALLATEWYKAEVVLAPSEAQRSLPGALSQLGGLASLAGINLAPAGDQKPVAVLRSRGFAREFIEDYKLVDDFKGRWNFKLDRRPHDVRDAVRYFDENIRTVTEDRRAGLVKLEIRWKDADQAAEWANLLVQRLNDRVRKQAEVESERNVTYLQREIASTSIVSMQQSLGRVLEIEMQKLLLARGNEEFAFKVIDSATPPKLRDWPKRTLITLLAGVLGGLLSLVIVLARHSATKSAESVAKA